MMTDPGIVKIPLTEEIDGKSGNFQIFGNLNVFVYFYEREYSCDYRNQEQSFRIKVLFQLPDVQTNQSSSLCIMQCLC